MVTRYGMSEKLGPRTFGAREELVFLGREISEQRNYSEEVAEEIDNEVKKIIGGAYTRAKEVLTTYRSKLDAVADRLVHEETIEGPEFEAMFAETPKLAPSPSPVPAPTPA
jgi:cell division protease FtsH